MIQKLNKVKKSIDKARIVLSDLLNERLNDSLGDEAQSSNIEKFESSELDHIFFLLTNAKGTIDRMIHRQEDAK